MPSLYVVAVAAGENIDDSGLLDGLDGQARADRAELIAWLLDHDFTVDQIRNAITPMLLPAGRVIGDDGVYVSQREVSAASQVDGELLARLQRAVGQPTVNDPDAAVYLRADVEAAARAKKFIDVGLAPDQVVTVARVLAEGLGQTAEVMRQAALQAVLAPGATELQIALAYEALVRQISPLLGPMIEDVLRLQLRHALDTEAVNAAERAEGRLPGARDVAVAFADLVGFTRLGEVVPAEDLEHLASMLSGLARDVATPPVRFIKTIGDAVMFVSTDPTALLRAVLSLVDATDDHAELPQLRVGMANGLAVSRAGDWFGSPVNLASRVTGVARPSAVLVTESAHDAIGTPEGIVWSFAGPRHLKGVTGEVKLFRARVQTEEA